MSANKPFATEHEYPRLRVGDVIVIQGREHIVKMVNGSRARCVPVTQKQVDGETRFGKKFSFSTDYAAVDISPNSECEILRRGLEPITTQTNSNASQRKPGKINPAGAAPTAAPVLDYGTGHLPAAHQITSSPTKRGRGRPPGSKNKSK